MGPEGGSCATGGGAYGASLARREGNFMRGGLPLISALFTVTLPGMAESESHLLKDVSQKRTEDWWQG